jgi:amino acid transporter
MTAQTTTRALPQEKLARRLGLWGSIGVVIGITIGSGIFRMPAGISTLVPSAPWMLAVWALGGVITMCGALSIAELAGALPQTGGVYVYLREGWGRPMAFLFGWSQLVLIRAAALGGIALPFGQYLMRSFGTQEAAVSGMTARYIAAGAILFSAFVNILGVQFGALVAGMSTAAKFGALAALVLASFVLGGAHGATAANFYSVAGSVDLGNFGLALVLVLFAYDGFADLSFASGEVSDPKRNLPRALILGPLAILAIYLLANLAYLYVQPIGVVANSPLVAAQTMATLFGNIGVPFISAVVMISTFGSLNGSMLASPRIFFALADDGLFFRPIARVHPRYRTPYVAIGLAAILGAALVLVRGYEQLAELFVVAIWPFYALGIAAIYRLRRRPDLERPYHALGYPVVPLIFIVGVGYLIVNEFVTRPWPTTLTFAIILSGLPVYYACFRDTRLR